MPKIVRPDGANPTLYGFIFIASSCRCLTRRGKRSLPISKCPPPALLATIRRWLKILLNRFRSQLLRTALEIHNQQIDKRNAPVLSAHRDKESTMPRLRLLFLSRIARR